MELRSRARCDAGPCDSVTVRVTPLRDTLPVLRVARLGGGPVTSQLLEARGGKILLVR